MKAKLTNRRILIAILVTITLAAGLIVSVLVFATGDSRLTIASYADVVRFQADGVATLQVRIFDLSGKVVWDSSVVSGNTIDWDRSNDTGERLAYGAYIYSAQGWTAQGGLDLQKNGKLALMPGDKVQLQAAPVAKSGTEPSPQRPATEEESRYAPMAYSHTGDFTISGNLGVGTETPGEKLEVNGNIRIGIDGRIYLPGQSPIMGSTLNTDQLAIGYSSLQAYLLMPGINRGSPIDDGSFLFTSRYSPTYGNSADIKFRTYDGTTVTQLMIVKRTGQVGIGTLSPAATLEVHGSATNLLALYDPVAPTDPKFRVEKDGDVYADGTYYCADGAFHVGSADVAERINTSEWVEPGDVVEIDPEHPGFFRKASSPYSTKVAGIISTSPGVILGNSFDASADKWEDNRPVLAVTGRVPCKVSTENGPIEIGDLLVASSTSGVAMKGNPEESMGAVVGKAMEPLEEGEGTIVVQVMLR